jgi:hypothetical protein
MNWLPPIFQFFSKKYSNGSPCSSENESSLTSTTLLYTGENKVQVVKKTIHPSVAILKVKQYNILECKAIF